jgi:hypothetical protein
MSPYAHYEIARAHQHEIATRTTNAHLNGATRRALNGQRSVKRRLFQAVAMLAVCCAAGTAVTVSEAHSNQRPMTQHAGHISAQQREREIRALEVHGYVPAACTVSGTLMRNYSTGQSVTVKW